MWPALNVHCADDQFLAVLDDFAPTALEEWGAGLRAFFATTENRDRARSTLADHGIAADAIDIPDDDWAVRSQQNLAPVTVGRITVVSDISSQLPHPHDITLVIQPSMGFGTGHHATTRLCLAALQTVEPGGAFVLDVGTGSGILAIGAARLGAAQAIGLDEDADAIQAARENLARNPEARHVQFEVADLVVASLPEADIVVANLTGALLVRVAVLLLAAVNPTGTLVVSGILTDEEESVRHAFSGAEVRQRQQEDEWVCLTLNPGPFQGV